MAPNVPSDQRDDALPCWAWGVASGGGKEASGAAGLEPHPPPSALKRQADHHHRLHHPLHKTAKPFPCTATAAATASSGKRLKLDLASNNNNNNNSNVNNNNNNHGDHHAAAANTNSLCAALRQHPQRCCNGLTTQTHLKAGKSDVKGGRSSVGVAFLQTDAAAAAGHPCKPPLQGKITEYFKAQMKPASGSKKDLAGKAGSAEFRSPVSQMLSRKGVADAKTDKSSPAGLDKFFNINSGTQPAHTAPLLKVPDVKSLVGTNLPVGIPVQNVVWNNKYDVVDSGRRCVKTVQNEEKMSAGVQKSIMHLSEELPLATTAAMLKIVEMKKKNGFLSTSLSSPNPNTLLLPPSSIQDTHTSLSMFSPNLPESATCVSNVVASEIFEVVCDVPKPEIVEETDALLQKDIVASSTPDKVSSVSEDPVISSLVDRSESVASVTSDSGLSISVSSSSPAPSSLPSPILSVPRTIRFPPVDCRQSNAAKRSSGDQSESTLCKWSECNSQFDSGSSLLEHLQAKHVNTQGMCETFVCLWVGCKVYGRSSCSRSWLERHVLSHGGNKPFRCIVEGCGHRFSTQTTLERHVNSHFNQSESASNKEGSRRSVESSSSKLFRRNGKRLRLRRQPWSARMFDYFDSGIMEGLQHRLMCMTDKRTLGEVGVAPGNTISLQSKVLARRIEPSGKAKVLLRWYPEDIVDDEWVLETDVQKTKTVPIGKLPSTAAEPVRKVLFAAESSNGDSSSNNLVAANGCSFSQGSSSASSCPTTTARRRPRKAGKPAS